MRMHHVTNPTFPECVAVVVAVVVGGINAAVEIFSVADSRGSVAVREEGRRGAIFVSTSAVVY
jgi:hypothetical protein